MQCVRPPRCAKFDDSKCKCSACDKGCKLESGACKVENKNININNNSNSNKNNVAQTVKVG